MQTAKATGFGNVIVQIGGVGNSVSIDRPHLALTRPSALARRILADPDTGKPRQIDVIRPATRSVEMVGRRAELRDLRAWLHTRSAFSVRVLIGQAGVGKTRLAIELVEAMAQEHWRAGFLTRRELKRFLAQQNLADWSWDTPVVAVVDDASASARHLHEWLEELASNTIWEDAGAQYNLPFRLLLLERHAERDTGWWAEVLGNGSAATVLEQLIDPAGPMILRSIDDPHDRRAILTNTLQSLGSNVRMPAPGDDPKFDGRLAEQAWGGVPLMLMMAAATAADVGIDKILAMSAGRLAVAVADTEVERILKVAEGSGVSARLKPLVKDVIAITVLRQGLTGETAYTVIDQESVAMGYDVAGGPAVLRDALTQALPDGAGGIAAVKPDTIGEAVLLSIWPASSSDAPRAIVRAHADEPTAVGATVVHTCQDYVIHGYRHALGWLRQLLDNTNNLNAMMELSNAMPTETLELREVRVDLDQKIVHEARRRLHRTHRGATTLAAALNNLSMSLSELGRLQEALAAIREAAELDRELAAARPDTLRPHLADSLTNLSSRLSEHGRHDEALAPIQEAVSIRRKLAATSPDAFRPVLATSLENLANLLYRQGRLGDALAPIQEAVSIRRKLAAAHPDAFRPALTKSLTNLSQHLARHGRRDGAMVAIREAVAYDRELAAARPDAFRPHLAGSLTNLSNRLYEQGRHDDALAPIQEAVSIRRKLAAAHPDAFRPVLAESLNNLASLLCESGRHDDALAPIREAVNIRRTLAAAHPDAFRPVLARSLTNLSNILCEHGRYDEALVPIQEAVDIRRDLSTTHPDAILPDLALSFNTLSIILYNLGRRSEALAAIERALKTLRDPFLSLPPGYSDWMEAFIGNYREQCKTVGKNCDASLLMPILETLHRLKCQSSE